MLDDTKVELRQRLGAARAAMLPAERVRQSALAVERLAGLAQLQHARTVALYAPLPTELDVLPLATRLRGRGMLVCYPRVRPDRRLDFVPVHDESALAPGFRGIREPQGEPVSIDVAVVPGLGFDRSGYRLGFGGGYYDRTLVGSDVTALGVCFECQVVDALPRLPHDLVVSAVVAGGTLLMPRPA